MAILDKHKQLKQNMSYFDYAEKCFDHLWLQDCLVDMIMSGMKEKEVDIKDTSLGRSK